MTPQGLTRSCTRAKLNRGLRAIAGWGYALPDVERATLEDHEDHEDHDDRTTTSEPDDVDDIHGDYENDEYKGEDQDEQAGLDAMG